MEVVHNETTTEFEFQEKKYIIAYINGKGHMWQYSETKDKWEYDFPVHDQFMAYNHILKEY